MSHPTIDVAGSSVAHHLLGSYQRSLLAILLAQFTKKRFSGGMGGVVRLATNSVTVQAQIHAPSVTIAVIRIKQLNDNTV